MVLWYRNCFLKLPDIICIVSEFSKSMFLSCVHYCAAQHKESHNEGNGMNWADSHHVSDVKYTMFPSFVFIGKLAVPGHASLWLSVAEFPYSSKCFRFASTTT
jgi:hypothetical protein